MRKPPTKKALKERFPGNKAFLLQFSEHHPEVLEDYKKSKSYDRTTPDSVLLQNFDPAAFAGVLMRRLRDIPSGTDAASAYHRFMIGTLSFILYPNLIYPKIEQEIHEGRKRIDIVYTNGVKSGIFARFTAQTGLISASIMVECKNSRVKFKTRRSTSSVVDLETTGDGSDSWCAVRYATRHACWLAAATAHVTDADL